MYSFYATQLVASPIGGNASRIGSIGDIHFELRP
jgi:hypothetical protein